MATKNIKKILLNKNGNKFVVDTENIVHSVNGVNPDENGNVSITSVANANHAITADSAANATNCTLKVNSSLTTSTYLSGNQGNVLVNSNASAGAYTMLTKLNSTNGKFTQGCYQNSYLLQYTTNATVNAGTNSVTKSVTLLNENGDSTFCGTVTAPTFKGALSGNATSATHATNATNLGGYPALKYVRSVNGVNADASGNVQLGNIGAITGEIKWFAFNTPPDGYLVCNGAWVSRTTYADLFAKIGTTFGSGDGSTTFTLPNLMDRFAQGSTTVGIVKSAGLPNIEGGTFCAGVGNNPYTSWGCIDKSSIGNMWNVVSGNGAPTWDGVRINASRSNTIYGNSSTVQPPALTLLPCIKY